MMPVLTNEDLDAMKGDIKELKALAAPPQAVKNTMEAVALLLGYSPSQAKVSHIHTRHWVIFKF